MGHLSPEVGATEHITASEKTRSFLDVRLWWGIKGTRALHAYRAVGLCVWWAAPQETRRCLLLPGLLCSWH